MKTTSLKNIYLKEYELKQAIIEYLEKTEPELAQHLYDNSCSMDWKSEYFVISIDGETDEKEYSVDINMAANKTIEQHSKAFEKLAEKKDRKQEHPPECKWHKDWHACDCGIFDKEATK